MPTSVTAMSASTALLTLCFSASLGKGTPCFSACCAASMQMALSSLGAGFQSAGPCSHSQIHITLTHRTVMRLLLLMGEADRSHIHFCPEGSYDGLQVCFRLLGYDKHLVLLFLTRLLTTLAHLYNLVGWLKI